MAKSKISPLCFFTDNRQPITVLNQMAFLGPPKMKRFQAAARRPPGQGLRGYAILR
jgi:hypothetical protein